MCGVHAALRAISRAPRVREPVAPYSGPAERWPVAASPQKSSGLSKRGYPHPVACRR